jgi:hypothetical protein
MIHLNPGTLLLLRAGFLGSKRTSQIKCEDMSTRVSTRVSRCAPLFCFLSWDPVHYSVSSQSLAVVNDALRPAQPRHPRHVLASALGRIAYDAMLAPETS